jgi:PAS domain S-box-containing protein
MPSAVVMGLAISGMHYAGMTAASYIPVENTWAGTATMPTVGQFTLSDLLIVAVAVFGLMLLLLTAQATMERQQAIDRLRESEARYRSISSSSTVGVIVSKLSGEIVEANDAFLQMVGYTRAALESGKLHWDQLTPSEFSVIDQQKVEELLKTGTTSDYEKQFVHANGHRVDVWIGGIAVVEGTADTAVACVLDITERKRAAQSLAESEGRLRQMVESNLIGIAFWNIYGKIYDANDAFLQMVGYSRQDMAAGRVNWKDLTRPEDQVLHAEKVQSAIAGEMVSPYETVLLHHDGQAVDVLVGYAMLKGAPERGYAFVLDISKRRRAEAALVESAQRFRFMAEAMPQKVWTALPSGEVDYVNENWLTFSGLSFEALRGWGWVEAVHPDDLEETLQVWRHSLANGSIFQMEHRLWRKDGAFRWHLSRGLPMPDEQGNIVMWVGTNTDIDDIKKTEQALKEREERFRVMADTAPIMIWVGDEEGGVLYGNRRWQEFTGMTPEETMGTGWTRMIHPDDRKAAYEGYLHALAERQTYQAEWRLFRISDQSFRWVMCTGIPLLTGSGDFNGYVGTMVDITDQKRANEELESRVVERTAQLQAVNKELEAFSYSVSHDLRAPLRTIDGFSQAIMEDYADRLDEDGKRYLQRVREGSQQMAQLIDDMLTLSRLTRGEVRKEAVDMSSTARKISADLQAQDPHRNVDFIIREGMVVQADKRLIQAVLQNLIGNAWKFTSNHPAALIEFGQIEKDGMPIYFVRDNGAGFDMAYADKLFGAFQRLHDTAEFPGTGIGLATVQRVIHRHGGEIWAEGAVEKGATFYFTLP